VHPQYQILSLSDDNEAGYHSPLDIADGTQLSSVIRQDSKIAGSVTL
jgi:hypothetical protein